jgi:hypothetical protein
LFQMHLIVERVCAGNICAHVQDSREQHTFGPPSGIELLTLFSSTAPYAPLLGRRPHNLQIDAPTWRLVSRKARVAGS